MSEDEIKPNAEEPTSEDVKIDVQEEPMEEDKKETAKDEDVNEENVKEEKDVEMKEENEEQVKTPKRKKPENEEETPVKGDGKPLYDQPLEQSGKRDRKKVERFVQEEKKEEIKVEGRGTALGDIPFVDYMITKKTPEELKLMHRIAYNRPGSATEVKKNLRKFNGLPFTKEDKKYESKKGSIEKMSKAEISKMLKMVGLEVSGSKMDVVERLIDFMLLPRNFGKKAPKPKKPSGGGRGRPKGGSKKEKKSKKSKSNSTDSVDEESSGSDSSVQEISDDDDEEDEPPKKKAKKTPAKKTPAKKPASAKKTPKTPKSKTPDSDDSSSDDEPLAKKMKQPPTDSELKGMVKKILDGANLEEVTMKSVCRQVYDSYPDFDLSHKKEFIKETVKLIIS